MTTRISPGCILPVPCIQEPRSSKASNRDSHWRSGHEDLSFDESVGTRVAVDLVFLQGARLVANPKEVDTVRYGNMKLAAKLEDILGQHSSQHLSEIRFREIVSSRDHAEA